MNVVDSSVLVDVLVGRLATAQLPAEPLAAPHLIDSEVLQALRRLERGGEITTADALAAVQAFAQLDFARHSVDGLHNRIWQLRHNLTAYDAAYAALAELLGATALLTRDGPLSRAPGLRCRVVVL